ncbi:uncharacterized protein LOC114411136 [Glycine soja]|uniref:uncharacterized protein n=1 Tax=Glycine max TaxID=3847 RepID=UPI000E21C070|nr:uncharacterized protein LOC113001655 [Glycine max]XP_028230693.1 uncharacterized protein LOC114411136 [Glycine soja]|eukprot:XP_025984336.1 uncharacterized protein LOC113001655 [Glycine max]
MPNCTLTGDSLVEAVDYTIKTREQITKLFHHNFLCAQERMKHYAGLKRVDKEFKCGDLVYLKIKSYKQLTLANHAFHKLAAKYYGSFKVLERIGKVAYKLELPTGTKIHDVFHNEEGEVQLQPLVVLDRRIKKKGNRAITEVLIQWRHTNPKDAVWKELYAVQQQFPNFDWNSNRP